MTTTINITEQNGTKVVSARELYENLGYNLSQWKRWYNKNVLKNPFAVENEDYIRLDIVSNHQSTKCFAITLDFAKRLSMLAKTEQGEKIRNYFIACEKKAKEVVGMLPTSYADALRQLADKTEVEERLLVTNEIQSKELKLVAPKVDYFNKVLDAKGSHAITKIASELGMSAIKLNNLLNLNEIQRKVDGTWVLRAKFLNKGFTDSRTTYFTRTDGTMGSSISMTWTEKGRQFIHELINKQKAVA